MLEISRADFETHIMKDLDALLAVMRVVVLPVLYRACNIPYRLNKLQYIDFLNKPYESDLSRVISDILMVVS